MDTLSPALERELASLAELSPAVDVLVLFGSAASKDMHASSDVDLYVRLAPSQTWSIDETQAFVSAASRACRREIDVVVESPSTSVILRREVAAKGRPLFERRAGAFRELVVDAVHAYMELEPQLRLIGGAIRARAAADGAAAIARLTSEARGGR